MLQFNKDNVELTNGIRQRMVKEVAEVKLALAGIKYEKGRYNKARFM